MNTSNKKISLAVIGNPISHSKSPEIHNNWANDLKLNLEYKAIKVENLTDFMNDFVNSDLLGFNVTIPYKEEIIDYLDYISPDANSIAAVNTVIKRNGKLEGYNTDILGIELSLKEHISQNSKVLVLGAGGASRAVIRYLNNNKIIPSVLNRSESKLNKLNQDFNIVKISKINPSDNFDILINTTPVGMINNDSPIDLSLLIHNLKFVFDLVYEPEMTTLLMQAKELNIKYLNGYSMLIEQAKQSFKIWTGIYP